MYFQNPNKRYNSKSHLVYSCQYHVVFCPKYRRKILKNGIDIRLKEIIQETAKQHDFQIVEMEVMPDHVHLLIDCNPRFGIMTCVSKIKSISSNILRKEFPEIKSKLPTLWTRSAFISTVGAVSLGVIRTYIENQKNK